MDDFRGGDSVQLRHDQVHECHVGSESVGESHCLRAVGCITHHFQCGVEVQERTQSLPNDLVVVGDQDADPTVVFPLRGRRWRIDHGESYLVWQARRYRRCFMTRTRT